MQLNKIKLTKEEFDELYEVEDDLTQPKIEDNIDKPEIEKDITEPEFLTQEEEQQDIEFHKDNPQEQKENE